MWTQKLLHIGGGSGRDKQWQRMYLRLPSEWVRELGLKQGDEVEIEKRDGGLFIWRKGEGKDE